MVKLLQKEQDNKDLKEDHLVLFQQMNTARVSVDRSPFPSLMDS